jgi:serine/threonine protein kinase
MILSKRYKIIEKIGQGRFSNVYRGAKIKGNTDVAIKMELSTTMHLLKNEATFLKYLGDQQIRHVPVLHWFGHVENHAFLVLSFYDSCLFSTEYPFEKARKYLQNAITILEAIHEKHVLHRDLKPENFMLKGDELFLIDFGLATFFLDDMGDQDTGVVGTPKYTSYFVHRGDSFGRRDDLLSLGYIFTEWIGKRLPWNTNGGSPKSNEEYILLKSWENMQQEVFYKNIDSEVICQEREKINQEGYKFLNYCYHLENGQRPHYLILRELVL